MMSQFKSTEAVTSTTDSSQTSSPPGRYNDEPALRAKPILGQPTITKPRSLSNPAAVSGGGDRQGTTQGNTRTYQEPLQSGSASSNHSSPSAAASLPPPAGRNSSSSEPTSVTRPPAIAIHNPAHLGSIPSSSTPVTAATAGHSTPTGLRVDTSISTKGPPAPPPKSPRHNPHFLRSLSADVVPPLPTSMGSGQSKATAPSSNDARQHHSRPLTAEKQPPSVAPHTSATPRSATLAPQTVQATRRSPSPSPRAAPPAASQSLLPTPAILTSAISQAPSTHGQPSTPTSMAGSFGNGASKLMRKFAGRRKKSEDATTLFAKAGQESDGEGPVRNGSRSRLDISVGGPRGPASPPTSAQGAAPLQPRHPPMPLVSSPPTMSPPTARKPSPIQVPPAMVSAVAEPVTDLRSAQELTVPANRDRASVMVISPGMASALDFMRSLQGSDGHVQSVPSTVNPRIPPTSAPAASSSLPASPVRENEESREGKTSSEMKEIWRKSDSTIGHHTLRQGAGSAKNSRPVSMAESFQSAFTVVPGMSAAGNKRWSTLTADMEIGVMVEEDGEDFEEAFRQVKQSPPASSSTKTSPVLSAKQQKRRSVSLNVGALSSATAQVAPSLVNANGKSHYGQEVAPLCYSASDSDAMPTPRPSYPATAVSPGDNGRSTRYQHDQSLSGPQPTASSGSSWRSHSSHDKDPRHQSNHSLDQVPSSATNLRQRFPGWSSSRTNAPPPSAMPPLSNSAYSHGPAPGPRAPTISLTNSLAPAAGLAKQAAKKLGGMGKKWMLSNSSSSSGYSSSTSSREAQAHAESVQGVPLGRTHSNQSSLASSMKSGATSLSSFGEIVHRVQLPSRSKDKKTRRTPNAPSGAYSMTSSVTSTSTSESDGFFTSSGPMLGVMVRGPIKTKQGTLISGIVFGQDLKTAVEQTMPVTVSNLDKDADTKVGGERERLVKEVQTRRLPALVTRCAQHLLIWGVQEEGLFRVSGRASHITRLRTEFDTGVDYDMTSCHPGDLDPHAVASVFKAYLRELPEAILTNNLHPIFEAAVSRELETNPSAALSSTKVATRQPGLPSSPKANMTTPIRKPPSLSTLAMPNFSGMPTASSALVRNLRSLIARLPQENRDLIRTIVQLMRATYQASKETKMPLSNLLLVFCPSLNMSPPLLKALCECEDIWSPSSNGAEAVMEIKRENVILDIKPTEQPEEPETPIVQNPPNVQSPPLEQRIVEQPACVETPAMSSESVCSRPPVPTIYLDTESHHSSSSFSSVQEIEARYDASMPSPPPLSSSAESVATPTSSTGHPSIHHLPASDGDLKGNLSRKSSVNELLRPDDGAQVVYRLDSPRRMNSEGTGVQGPVEFPSSAPLPTAHKRRSLALLSLSGFSAISPASSSSQDSEERGLRDKKPSLRRLFTKRSTASLVSNHSGPARSSVPLQHSPGALAFTPPTPGTATSSTVSTPISAVTAPQYSASMLPPVLDMHIDTGTSLSFDFGFDVDDSSDDHSQFTPGQAESAVFTSALTSQVSLFTQDESKHPYGRGRSESTASTASSNHLGYEDSQEDEDWMKTVLAAACGDKI